jgi:tRNA/tmRNA/rRNA uracil-C5-methylase (TrmA/RlmC/RlmD family)
MKPHNGSVKPGDILTVEISKIVPRGLGLGYAEGSTVFVPLAAAGDKLSVRVREVKGGTAFAEIEEVLEPSTDRIEPPCPYFGSCGGCDFQQMNYGAQLSAKVCIIRDCLHRIGKIEHEAIDVIASPLEFGYRTRAQWHADVNEHTIGYFRRLSHDVIDVEKCPIASPSLNEALGEIRRSIEWETIWGNRIAIDAANGEDGEVSVYSSELTIPTSEITTSAAGERFSYTARNFFQGNSSVISQLVDAALLGAAGETAFDLYSGVGLFSLPLARKFKTVTAVEENAGAVELAEKNARRAEIRNVKFVRGKVDHFVRDAKSGEVGFLLLDPPRAGGSKETVLNIARLAAREISYVSCEPSTLARDLRWLLDCGYQINKITAVDMFPQTHHIETVVRLERS